MPMLSTSSASKKYSQSQKPPHFATRQALLSLAIASIFSTTALAAESNELTVQQIAAQEADEQQDMPSTELDTIVVLAARDELVQAPGLSIIRAC